MNSLEWLKSVDRPELLFSFLKDREAKKVLVAWTSYDPEKFPFPELAASPEELIGEPPRKENIRMIWEPLFKTMDWEILALLAGVPKITAKLKFNFLRFNFMIYPDGTANPSALDAIRGEVTAHINGVKNGALKNSKIGG